MLRMDQMPNGSRTQNARKDVIGSIVCGFGRVASFIQYTITCKYNI